MKKTLKCGCDVDYKEIEKLPIITCPNCNNKIHHTKYCVCCGQKLREETEDEPW